MKLRTLGRLSALVLGTVPVAAGIATLAFAHPWWTPDQQGARFFEQGEYLQAAQTFRDPAWRAAALYARHLPLRRELERSPAGSAIDDPALPTAEESARPELRSFLLRPPTRREEAAAPVSRSERP